MTNQTTTTKNTTVKTPVAKAAKVKTPNQIFASLLNSSDNMQVKVSAVKFAIALAVFAKDVNAECTIETACKLYGVENKAKAQGYERAKGFHKDYLKPVFEARQYLGDIFKGIRTVNFNQNHAKVAQDILDLPIYGANSAPQNKGQWLEVINGYLPKDKQQTNPTGRKGQGKKAAKGKGGDDSAVNEANSNVNNAVIEAIAAAAQDHKAYVNGYLNQLDEAGLPKAHRAKVAKVMLAMLDDYKTSIEKAATK